MKHIPAGIAAASLAFALHTAPVFVASAKAEDNTAICYNCPPQWADWGTMLKKIKEKTGIDMPQDNKNSGQSLSQIIAEKASPVADVVYYGVTFGIKGAAQGLVTPYKPKGFDEVPEGLKAADGSWVAVHYGTMGFFVNKDALGDAPVPKCWADLEKPEYDGMVGYLDPSSAFVGYAGAVAVNRALGGTLDNFDPAIDFFKKLAANNALVPKQTAYARVVSGEIPILFDYDFNAYRAKYNEGGNFEFVIPCEGTLSVPYVMSQVANDPHPENAHKVLDYVLSDEGQAVWANAYLKPSRPVKLPDEIAKRFLPDSEYERAKPIDYGAMEAAQDAFSKRYLEEVK